MHIRVPLVLNSRLKLLQDHDKNRAWASLKDRRVCVLCSCDFSGLEIRIWARLGKPFFSCPNPECKGTLQHFVKPGNPLLNEEIWWDWMSSSDAQNNWGDEVDSSEIPSAYEIPSEEAPTKSTIEPCLRAS